ncbi:MAG TPA: hypothetical protein VIB62_00700 [Actinomycetota bacterium]|jgi:ribosomal protein S18 acetylase RimI-like enzyme
MSEHASGSAVDTGEPRPGERPAAPRDGVAEPSGTRVAWISSFGDEREPGTAADDLRIAGFDIVSVPSGGSRPGAILDLTRRLRRGGFRIAHVRAATSAGALEGVLGARMAGVPAVVTTAAPDASGYDGLARWSRRLSHLALPSSETDAQGGSLVDAYQEVLLRRGLARRRVDLVGLRSVTLRRARTADVPAIARMHVEVLSSGSLQLLGEPFLRELFRAQVLDPDAVVVVADREGEVIGYSSGVVSTSAFRRRFATRHGIRAGIVALPRLLDRDVARKLFETARYPDTTRDLPDAEHLFLGVRRGTAPGLGAVLTREVIDVLGRRGAEEVKGFVSAENGPMLLMLRRVGFEVRGELSLHDGHPSYVVVIRCPTPSPSSSAAS